MLHHEDLKDWLLEEVDNEKFQCKRVVKYSICIIKHGYQIIEMSQCIKKKHLKLRDSKYNNYAITSYYGGANSLTSSSATFFLIAAEIFR